MKRNIWLWSIVFLFGLTSSTYPFAMSLEQEPFINSLSPKMSDKGDFTIHIQHYFLESNVASLAVRLGYVLADDIEMYATGRYHATDTGDTKFVGREIDILYLQSFLKEDQESWIDLSLEFGAGSRREKFTQEEVTLDTRNFFQAHLLTGRTFGNIFYAMVSPDLVYDAEAQESYTAVTGALKLIIKGSVALTAELSSLMNNPLDWEDPWSAGIQFHIGPHILTLFVANTSGFTASQILQGTKNIYGGFRFAF